MSLRSRKGQRGDSQHDTATDECVPRPIKLPTASRKPLGAERKEVTRSQLRPLREYEAGEPDNQDEHGDGQGVTAKCSGDDGEHKYGDDNASTEEKHYDCAALPHD